MLLVGKLLVWYSVGRCVFVFKEFVKKNQGLLDRAKFGVASCFFSKLMMFG